MKRSMNFTSPENILSLAEFKYMLDLLLNMQAKDVALKFGISQSRAEIVPAAFACVIGLLEFWEPILLCILSAIFATA